MTDPLDDEELKKYESKPNPFIRSNDKDHPNNCIAVCGFGKKKEVPVEKQVTKVI